MRPAAFSYPRPTTLADALEALHSGATPLAGGQSLLRTMRLPQTEPKALFELKHIAELDGAITLTAERVRIGALVTHRELAGNGPLACELPWLAEAVFALGDVQVRNLGTIVGNVCWADPRANMAVALLASDAVVVTAAAGGVIERIAIDDFFVGFRLNTLGPRLAAAIEIPRRANARGSYIEFARQPQDLAIANACVVVADGSRRVAVGGIDPTPVRLPGVETAMATHDADSIAKAIADDLYPALHEPIVDQCGSAEYKLGLAETLVRRALTAIGSASDA